MPGRPDGRLPDGWHLSGRCRCAPTELLRRLGREEAGAGPGTSLRRRALKSGGQVWARPDRDREVQTGGSDDASPDATTSREPPDPEHPRLWSCRPRSRPPSQTRVVDVLFYGILRPRSIGTRSGPAQTRPSGDRVRRRHVRQRRCRSRSWVEGVAATRRAGLPCLAVWPRLPGPRC